MYIRLSKEDIKPGESESISNQRSMLTRFCISNSLHVVGEYVDDGISGTTFDRPAFKQMVRDIENKKINMVITKDLSRLGRDYIEVGHYLEKYFPEKNVRYVSLLDGIDTSIDSSLNDITPFKSILNDMYAKDISNKIKSVKHNKQDLGLFIGSKAPYGYMTEKGNPNKLVIDNEAGGVVQRIFREVCYGKSCRAIANDLNVDGVMTPSQYALAHNLKVSKVGFFWSDSRIREIILNEVYIGNMVQGRMKKVSYKSKKNIRLPKSEWKVVKNTHNAIIDKDMFYRANKMLDIRKKTRIKSYDYILKGLVYCHECKNKMGVSTRQTSKDYVHYFRCNTYVSNPKLKICSSHSVRKDKVESIVLDKVMSIINEKITKIDFAYITKEKFNKVKNGYNIARKLEELDFKLEKLSKNIDVIYEDKLNGILQYEDFKRIYESKIKEKSSVENQILRIKNGGYINYKFEENIENVITKFKNNFILNREILCTLIQKIEISEDKKIYIFFNFKNISK